MADYAARKRVPQAFVVKAALASHLSPDGADRLPPPSTRLASTPRGATPSNVSIFIFRSVTDIVTLAADALPSSPDGRIGRGLLPDRRSEITPRRRAIDPCHGRGSRLEFSNFMSANFRE
jgi:hypothetical protein